MHTHSAIRRASFTAALLLTVVASTMATTAAAEETRGPCAASPSALPPDPRLRAIEVDGRRVVVIVPSGYDGARRHPVLYLLHGGFSTPESAIRGLDLLRFTAGSDVIVAVPEGGEIDMWADWRTDPRGARQWQTHVLRKVIPAVDREFATIPRRSQRAIAGLSMGGYGALAAAARAPDLFATVGSFSGIVDPGRSLLLAAMTPTTPAVFACFDGDAASGYDIYGGSPATHGVWYADASPIDTPRNLAGVETWFTIGDGTPCDASDAEVLLGDPGDAAFEPDFKRMNDELDRALTRAGVAHEYVPPGCGVHTYRYFRRHLEAFWPVMLSALGAQAPDRFDYRTARASFALYGWDFRADPRRADEFLDVTGAGPAGLTLRGSGPVEVSTPPRFEPGQTLTVTGGGGAPFKATADGDGRLALTIDLGAPHRRQEGSIAATLEPERFVTRTVRFSPPMRRPADVAYR